MRRVVNGACVLVVCLAWGSNARAQQPVTVVQTTAAAPEGFHGSAGFGLSLTQGNSDTLNINAAIDNTYDPKTKNAMRWNALFLRGKQNGVLSVYRLSAMFRDEYTVNGRVFTFAQMDALHDTFKGVDYLLAPSSGVGYKVIDTKPTSLNVDAGVGGVVEKDIGFAPMTTGALTLSQKLIHQLSETTTLKENVTSLLKMDDVADGLYTFQIGVAAKVNSRLQLSVDLLDTFKNHPVDGLSHKHDLALVTSIVAKY